MSGFIERVKISKVLLMQDMDLTEKFVGKSLDEIWRIPFEDILTPGPETCCNENRAESQAEVDAEHTSLECQAEVDAEHTSLDAPDGYGSMDEDDHTISNGDEEEFEGKRKRKPPQKGCKRQKFTEVETEEIKTYFSEYLKSGICPRKQQVEDAKQKSRKKTGQIWKRSNDKIIKKISAMNHKKK
ncbi:uncharacterized protein LOC127875487 isoform X4 [Dreissena polymorpha]|uniref:uncharacterized protein LOC127875487 isoform X4 n=1 Tax=Dreissena polymorpha TaxID=45954 RepID=UPI002264FA11|nr:uncharacterized protein LOC127875487 isoform X4 [Dreissena polymorpha]